MQEKRRRDSRRDVESDYDEYGPTLSALGGEIGQRVGGVVTVMVDGCVVLDFDFLVGVWNVDT